MLHRITTLGEPRYPSPLSRFVSDDWSCRSTSSGGMSAPQQEWGFELAGPRAKLFFDPHADPGRDCHLRRVVPRPE